MNPVPSVAADAPTREPRLCRPDVELGRWTAGGLAGLLWIVAVVLGWRRLVGALSSPLDVSALAAVGLSVAIVAVAARATWQYRPARMRKTRSYWLLSGAVSIAVVAIGAAVSLQGTSPSSLIVLWIILAAEEVGALYPMARRGWKAWARISVSVKRKTRLDPPQVPAPPANPFAAESDRPPAGDVTQQLIRSHTADGREVLSGWMRVLLEAHQRYANVHVAFCPPFSRTPRVSVDQLEGPSARIKTVQVLPFAAMFALKVARQSEDSATVLLRFSAEAALATTSNVTPPNEAELHDE